MRRVDPRTGIEVLDRAQCLELLAEHEIGRLGVVTGGEPDIFPVNYALDGSAIVVRTADGTKSAAAGHAAACFEVDDFDRERRGGWSVVVHGRLEAIDPTSGPVWERITRLPVDPWTGSAKPRWLRLTPVRISGRRVPGTSSPRD